MMQLPRHTRHGKDSVSWEVDDVSALYIDRSGLMDFNVRISYGINA